MSAVELHTCKSSVYFMTCMQKSRIFLLDLVTYIMQNHPLGDVMFQVSTVQDEVHGNYQYKVPQSLSHDLVSDYVQRSKVQDGPYLKLKYFNPVLRSTVSAVAFPVQQRQSARSKWQPKRFTTSEWTFMKLMEDPNACMNVFNGMAMARWFVVFNTGNMVTMTQFKKHATPTAKRAFVESYMALLHCLMQNNHKIKHAVKNIMTTRDGGNICVVDFDAIQPLDKDPDVVISSAFSFLERHRMIA